MSTPRLRVRDLTLGYGSFVLMRDVNFDVAADDIFLIMGGSGCGKSSLLRTLMGLKQPQSGRRRGRSFTAKRTSGPARPVNGGSSCSAPACSFRGERSGAP